MHVDGNHRLLGKGQAAADPSEIRRTERWLATARVFLAVSALVAIRMDPTQLGNSPAAYGLLALAALPHGLRGLLGDLYATGATVDFSVLYPGGHLVDAPLPTWIHRPLLLSRDGHESPTHGGCTISVHPLLGSHVRLHEEPELALAPGQAAEVTADVTFAVIAHRVSGVIIQGGERLRAVPET